jgi:hypothetical protein
MFEYCTMNEDKDSSLAREKEMVYMSPSVVLRAFPTWLTSDNAVRVHNEVGSQVWKVASRPKPMPNEEPYVRNQVFVRLSLFLPAYRQE